MSRWQLQHSDILALPMVSWSMTSEEPSFTAIVESRTFPDIVLGADEGW